MAFLAITAAQFPTDARDRMPTPGPDMSPAIHGDLGAKNVLVGDNNIAKVADFGMTRCMSVGKEYTTFSIKWAAPEAALRKTFSSKSDVWSFGILLSEVVTYGGVPYPGMTDAEVLKRLDGDGYRMPIPPGCPETMYQIMLDCWKGKAQKRPEFGKLRTRLEDFYLKNVATDQPGDEPA